MEWERESVCGDVRGVPPPTGVLIKAELIACLEQVCVCVMGALRGACIEYLDWYVVEDIGVVAGVRYH